jgi:hypothetical protein
MKEQQDGIASIKLSWRQEELIFLIDDHSDSDKEGNFLIPPNRPTNTSAWSYTLGRFINVEGSGTAASLKALERKGLITFIPKMEFLYYARITEEGRLWTQSHGPEGSRNTKPPKDQSGDDIPATFKSLEELICEEENIDPPPTVEHAGEDFVAEWRRRFYERYLSNDEPEPTA